MKKFNAEVTLTLTIEADDDHAAYDEVVRHMTDMLDRLKTAGVPAEWSADLPVEEEKA